MEKGDREWLRITVLDDVEQAYSLLMGALALMGQDGGIDDPTSAAELVDMAGSKLCVLKDIIRGATLPEPTREVSP